MPQILIPGVGWLDSPGGGGQFLMPGETWLDEGPPVAPAPPPPGATALPTAARLAMEPDEEWIALLRRAFAPPARTIVPAFVRPPIWREDEAEYLAPMRRAFAPPTPTGIVPFVRPIAWRDEELEFRTPASRRFAPVTVLADTGGISILW